MAEIIYVLTNEAMPGLVKIGRTTTNVEQRIRELDTTGIPLPFQCFYAGLVNDGNEVERKIHYIFGEQRCRRNREFFRVDPNRVKAAIELAEIEDITKKIESEMTEDDARALADNERRQVFRFSLAKVPEGSLLQFTRDASKTCKVLNDRSVEFEGRSTTLSAAASELLQSLGWKSKSVAGPLFWSYEGESLDERRRRFEEEG